MKLENVASIVKNLIESIGEDANREGLKSTPNRVAKLYQFMTKGYHEDPREAIGRGIFESPTEEMVVVRNIDFYSLCEHHMVPFFGQAHIAYLPNKKIVGLSKLARLVDVFARRLQVQERLTEQVAHTLQDLLNPKGVAVVIEAQHLCMMMRGVQKINSVTTTSSLLGSFREDPATRAEFMNLIRRR